MLFVGFEYTEIVELTRSCRYRTDEELPELGKMFYEKASRNIGISLKGLVRGVFQTEVGLENWRLEERRRQLIDTEEE